MSQGTLRNAQQGVPIQRSWDDLLTGVLGVFRAVPDEHLRGEFRARLRRWDQEVSELPPFVDLSLAEHVHALLVRAIPEVGIRLGAISALAASCTNTPIDDWRWLVQPFDDHFFGNVVDALFRYRRRDLSTNEERKEALKKDARIHWRTVKRWFSGDIDVPNAAPLEALGGMLGGRAEMMLRAARLVCVLRRSLREWIGDDSAAEWAGAVADVGRATARTLSNPAELATLLRLLHDELEGPRGDDVLAGLYPPPPREVRAWSRQELCERLVSDAGEIAGGATVERPLARWVISLTLTFPHPVFSARVCNGMLGLLPVTDIFRLTALDWAFRSLIKAIAGGGTLPVTYVDGSCVERPISDRSQEIARRWVATSLRFRQTEEESPGDLEIFGMLFEVLGPDIFSGHEQRPDAKDPILGLIEKVIDPAAAAVLPDDVVARSCSLCLSRARALAERGDSSGAFDWMERARLAGPMTPSETDDLIGTLSALAHQVLDEHRCIRQCLRCFPDGADSALLRAALHDCVRLVGGIVTMIMESHQPPDTSSALLTALVAAIPVAIRLAVLRGELSSEDGGAARRTVEAFMTRLHVCLNSYPTHGRGLAVVALWTARCQVGAPREVEKRAVHYGAAAFLERERERIELDLV